MSKETRVRRKISKPLSCKIGSGKVPNGPGRAGMKKSVLRAVGEKDAKEPRPADRMRDPCVSQLGISILLLLVTSDCYSKGF